MLIKTALISLIGISCWAYEAKTPSLPGAEKPRELEGIGISEKLGVQLDLSLLVRDEQGQMVPLSRFFDGNHPVILSPVYFSCPGLCNFHLNGLTDTLKTLEWSIGDKFQLIALSFDARETAEVATKKKNNYLKVYNRSGAEKGWHFLTADQETINKITQAVGFQYKWNEEAKEWAHASAAIVITPDGKISRYLHGIVFEKNDIKFALGEATNGRIGSLVDRMVWYCFKYDPHQSKYTLYAFRLVQLGGVIMILVLAALLVPHWLRSRRQEAGVKG